MIQPVEDDSLAFTKCTLGSQIKSGQNLAWTSCLSAIYLTINIEDYSEVI